MTSLDDRIKQTIHSLIKPTLSYLIAIAYNMTAPLIKEKEEKGWDVELVQRFRRVFYRWLEREVDYGSMRVKIFRPYLRQLFDMLCLMADVEPHKTEQGWKFLKEELKREGLI